MVANKQLISALKRLQCQSFNGLGLHRNIWRNGACCRAASLHLHGVHGSPWLLLAFAAAGTLIWCTKLPVGGDKLRPHVAHAVPSNTTIQLLLYLMLRGKICQVDLANWLYVRAGEAVILSRAQGSFMKARMLRSEQYF